MAYSAAGPVSVAVYGLLAANSTLAAALPGGWHDSVPQNPAYPFGLYEVAEVDVRGFGGGGLPEVSLRTWVYTTDGTMAVAQEANRLTVAVLRDAALTVSGYTQGGRIVYHESVPLPGELLHGFPVQAIASNFTIWVVEN